MLRGLAPPVQLLIGNHDDRRVFRRNFPDCAADADGFIQSVRDVDAGRLVFLDTNEPGTHAGVLCAQRQRWLRERLEEAPDRSIYIFMHHHPFPIKYRPCDDIGLMQADGFATTIEGFDVRHIFFGHVHRPIAGSWRGVTFTALRGLNHQVWLDFHAPPGVIPCSLEPPAYAVILIDRDGVVVHTHDFLDESPKYAYRPDAPEDSQITPIARTRDGRRPQSD
jgi:3',5'-cyclic-AMP phosphodiesterase